MESVKEGTEIFRYKESAYAPLRFIAEEMGGRVDFDDNTQTIHIRHAEQVATKKDWEFTSSLYSLQETYRADEPITMWVDLLYTGDEARVKLVHFDSNLVSFKVTNQDGIATSFGHLDISETTMLERYSKYRAPFSRLFMSRTKRQICLSGNRR
ncbi:hypothetical protein [Paenibacillus sp. y28]|uniref:hypothetical protein n=1 Tax=Paenibacillus sp. y28 TaxID=3129110 RepID=UPI003016FC91